MRALLEPMNGGAPSGLATFFKGLRTGNADILKQMFVQCAQLAALMGDGKYLTDAAHDRAWLRPKSGVKGGGVN